MFFRLCAHLTLVCAVILLMALCLSGCAAHRSITVEKTGNSQADIVEPTLSPDNVQADNGKPVTTTPQESCAPILFDFDHYNIREDQEFVVAQNVPLAQTSKVLWLEGYCDERGSIEYNVALGQRRADTVRKALIARGVTATLQTVSYGKERATGHDEIGWAMDRKVEFVRLE